MLDFNLQPQSKEPDHTSEKQTEPLKRDLRVTVFLDRDFGTRALSLLMIVNQPDLEVILIFLSLEG